MKIPSEIKIGAHTYEVRFEEGFGANHGLAGQSRHQRNVIVIDPDQAQSQIEDTFIHEILHAINSQVTFAHKDDEEDSVSRIAPLLLQVIKDNKEVFSSEA